MFWAACNLAYFGFLRSAEFMVPNLASYVPAIHLGVEDVAVDSHLSPSCLHLRIKASKTDPFRKGCFLHIGKGEFPLCAISSLLAYLTLRGDASGPLFLFRDGRPLSRALLTSWLRGILSAAFCLLLSRCLDCLSSCLFRPLIDGLFQVLWGSVSCARFCVANFGVCWCCLLPSWTWPRDSQLFSGESHQIGSLCWVRAYWFQRPIDSPSEPLASVSSAFGVVCIAFIFMCRVVGFDA